jgi:hypothetical protein
MITPTPSGVPPRPRPVAALRAELDDLRRHLVDTPPHHGAGTRRSVEERIAELEATLRRLETR